MNEMQIKQEALNGAGKLEKIRLLGELVGLASQQAPDRVFPFFDELWARYRDYLGYDPKPPVELSGQVAQALVRVFVHIRNGSDMKAFDRYEPVFRELDVGLKPLDRARIYQVFGYIYWLKNEIDSSLSYLQNSLNIVTENNIMDEIPERYANLGYVYEYVGDYKKAEKYYKEGLDFAQRQNFEQALILAYSGMGRLHLRLKNYRLAAQYLERNLALVGESGSLRERATIITNLANAHLNLGNMDKALELNLQLDDKNLEEYDPELYSTVVLNIGCCFFDKRDYEQARPYLLKAYNYAEKFGDVPQLIFALINLAKIANIDGDLKQAREHLRVALGHARKANNQEQLIVIQDLLGETLALKGDHIGAIGHYEAAYCLAEGTGDLNARFGISRKLALCHERRGDYEQAYRYLAGSLKLEEEIKGSQKEADEEIKAKKHINTGRKTQYLFSDSMSLISKELSDRIGQWLIGTSKELQEAVEKAYIAARNERVNVMLYGESGTGKELIARLIHHSGSRAEYPFVEVNSAVFTTTLAQSSLFGHKKGAFTGANESHPGYFESAHKGTLFLDEISQMPPEIQSMMLRVLETKRIRPLGSNADVSVDFRLICASNHPMGKLVEDKLFRFDLFNRINTLEIKLPPLRERKADIPLLVNYFISSLSAEMNVRAPSVSPKALGKLCDYDYPGNIRELKNIIQRLLLFGKKDPIDQDDILLDQARDPHERLDPGNLDLEEHEKLLIKAALNRSGNVVTNAAKLLGISPFALARRLRKYGIGGR